MTANDLGAFLARKRPEFREKKTLSASRVNPTLDTKVPLRQATKGTHRDSSVQPDSVTREYNTRSEGESHLSRRRFSRSEHSLTRLEEKYSRIEDRVRAELSVKDQLYTQPPPTSLNLSDALLIPCVSLLTVSRTVNFLFKVLFIFPSRYLFAIGLVPVFSFRRSLPPLLGCIPKQPDSEKTPRRRASSNTHGVLTLYDAPFQVTLLARLRFDNASLDYNSLTRKGQRFQA